MAFGTFGSLEEVVRHYQVVVRQAPFIQALSLAVDERFRKRLEFVRTNAPVSACMVRNPFPERNRLKSKAAFERRNWRRC